MGKKSNHVKLFTWAVYISVILMIVIDFFIDKHPHFHWEEYPSFYGIFGLLASFVLIFGAKYILRKIVKREENYYD